MSHNIYTEKFITATNLRNEILKKQDKKIKSLIRIVKSTLAITLDINAIRVRDKLKEKQLKLTERADAIVTVYNNLDRTEEVLRELLGTKTLTAMTNNFTTAEENNIAQRITEIFEVLKNAETI